MMQSESAIVQRRRKSFSRNKKTVLKIDMTPMVDLGFLLITFFVFTTTISSPTVTELFMPNDSYINNPTTLADSYALTMLLDEKNQLYYYEGNWENAKNTKSIFKTNFSVSSGLGAVIRKKQQELDRNIRLPEGRKGLMLLIKPSSMSVYRNVIDALDEALINEVKKYAIIELTADEIAFLEKENS